ncbi:MAG: type II toxin-antitoxin system YafQ family toxin [Kiritimatiellae bacterium]|nr:type II toxin-antitoxin system YafQ family toxin [Kiritimatiellia bacterium]
MKFAVKQTARFKKSLKKMLKRGKDMKKLVAVVRMLALGEQLPTKYRDHALSGNLTGLRDCHIENDWVLLYYYQDNILVLTLADTGTHSDLSL